MRLYGYTDRFGGLECLKKTSDCFGVSLRGSTSSFLKQAERRLQRGTREKEEVKASDFVCSHQLNTETPSYLHDHSEKEQNAWEAIPAPSLPPSFKISQRGLPKIFKKKWEKAVVVNQNHQNHLYNLKKKKNSQIPQRPGRGPGRCIFNRFHKWFSRGLLCQGRSWCFIQCLARWTRRIENENVETRTNFNLW